MTKRKCVIVVLDGAADGPHPDHGGLTPYEVADAPTLNRLAAEGRVGLLHPLGIGRIGGSDTGHLALLGEDPTQGYTGRGPLECAGVGIDLLPGDVSIRCNYVTLGTNFEVVNRTAGYPREGIGALEEALNTIRLSDPEVVATFRNSADYRCVVHFRGPGLSAAVSDIDPSYHTIVGPDDGFAGPDDPMIKKRFVWAKPLDQSPEAAKFARLLNEWTRKAHEVLEPLEYNERRAADGLPRVNGVMPRGPGETPTYENFTERWGLRGGVVAGTGLIRGLGRLKGMTAPMGYPNFTGYTDTDYEGKARLALDLLGGDHDLVLLHLEGIDEVGHDRNFQAKVAAIRDASECTLKVLAEEAPPNTLICVVSDHTTCCTKGDHNGDPVPFLVWANDRLLLSDRVTRFNERDAAGGGYGHVNGLDLMPILLDHMGRAQKFGA